MMGEIARDGRLRTKSPIRIRTQRARVKLPPRRDRTKILINLAKRFGIVATKQVVKKDDASGS